MINRIIYDEGLRCRNRGYIIDCTTRKVKEVKKDKKEIWVFSHTIGNGNPECFCKVFSNGYGQTKYKYPFTNKEVIIGEKTYI